MSLVMILQLLIVLGALWVGSRYGSLALGAISGIGLALLVFGFGLKPGTPPSGVSSKPVGKSLVQEIDMRKDLKPNSPNKAMSSL